MTRLIMPLHKVASHLHEQIELATAVSADYRVRDREQAWYEHNLMLLEAAFDDLIVAQLYEAARDEDGAHSKHEAGRKQLTYYVDSDIRNSIRRQALYLEALHDRLYLFPQASASDAGAPYVDLSRLDELRRVKLPAHDLKRLVRLCEELNFAWSAAAYHAVIMLLRAILDHVPPLFAGAKDFGDVANHYRANNRVFKAAASRLDTSARQIANLHLHAQMADSEVLPNATQINFAQELDQVLAEIVRIGKINNSAGASSPES